MTRRIKSEDANLKHLLDVFISTDTNLVDVWDAFDYLVGYVYWHKRRLVTLGPKIEGLSNGYPSEQLYTFQLSWSFRSAGNCAKCKRPPSTP